MLLLTADDNTANAELELWVKSSIRDIACKATPARSFDIREAAHVDGIVQARI